MAPSTISRSSLCRAPLTRDRTETTSTQGRMRKGNRFPNSEGEPSSPPNPCVSPASRAYSTKCPPGYPQARTGGAPMVALFCEDDCLATGAPSCAPRSSPSARTVPNRIGRNAQVRRLRPGRASGSPRCQPAFVVSGHGSAFGPCHVGPPHPPQAKKCDPPDGVRFDCSDRVA